MAPDKAVSYIKEHGPLTPKELADIYNMDNGHHTGEGLWEDIMSSTKELVRDDSGRFHLRGDLDG